MLLPVKSHPSRVTYVQRAVTCVCVLSLILVLANRVPRIPSCERTLWVPSVASQITARVVAKDFFVLLPPATGSVALLQWPPSLLVLRERSPLASISLDNRLFTRPPPGAWAETVVPKNISSWAIRSI